MAQFSVANVVELFKINYGKLSENVYNSSTPILSRQRKNYNFTGRQKYIPVPTSFTGGVGSGTLPTSNFSNVEDANLFRKKCYSVITIDRESIKASADDKGSFIQATKWNVQKGVESYARNDSRMLFSDGTGSLGTIDAGGVVDNGAGNYDVTISDATWKEANWEEMDYTNVGASTDLFEVVLVTPATKVVQLQRITGSTAPAAADIIYMQGSKDNDKMGFKGVLDFNSGSLYDVDYSRRWSATRKDAGGAGLNLDAMNEVMLEVQRRSGKVPNLIVTGFTQYRKFLNLLESQKQYIIEPRMKELKGKVSFNGIEFMSTAGAVPVIVDRFCDDDRIYFVNDNFIDCHMAPGFGWFTDKLH